MIDEILLANSQTFAIVQWQAEAKRSAEKYHLHLSH